MQSLREVKVPVGWVLSDTSWEDTNRKMVPGKSLSACGEKYSAISNVTLAGDALKYALFRQDNMQDVAWSQHPTFQIPTFKNQSASLLQIISHPAEYLALGCLSNAKPPPDLSINTRAYAALVEHDDQMDSVQFCINIQVTCPTLCILFTHDNPATASIIVPTHDTQSQRVKMHCPEFIQQVNDAPPLRLRPESFPSFHHSSQIKLSKETPMIRSRVDASQHIQSTLVKAVQKAGLGQVGNGLPGVHHSAYYLLQIQLVDVHPALLVDADEHDEPIYRSLSASQLHGASEVSISHGTASAYHDTNGPMDQWMMDFNNGEPTLSVVLPTLVHENMSIQQAEAVIKECQVRLQIIQNGALTSTVEQRAMATPQYKSLLEKLERQEFKDRILQITQNCNTIMDVNQALVASLVDGPPDKQWDDFIQTYIHASKLAADEDACPICCDNQSNCILHCKHMLCNQCCTRITKCPFCRSPLKIIDTFGI